MQWLYIIDIKLYLQHILSHDHQTFMQLLLQHWKYNVYMIEFKLSIKIKQQRTKERIKCLRKLNGDLKPPLKGVASM